MLIFKERLEHVPIMSLQTGAQIAETGDFIIDPRQLKIVGFYCKGPRLDINPAILNVSDVRELSNIGLIVDSADVLMSPEDLVRLKDVLEFRFTLDGKPVVDTAGNKLGQVATYTLDSTTLYIVKLQVRPGLLQSFKTTELIIDRNQVVEVNDHRLVVRDLREKTEEPAKTAAPLLENPFRRAPVESSTTDNRK